MRISLYMYSLLPSTAKEVVTIVTIGEVPLKDGKSFPLCSKVLSNTIYIQTRNIFVEILREQQRLLQSS